MTDIASAKLKIAPDLQPVLVPVDFSDDSRAALLWACEYVGDTGAPIVLLHVVHDPAWAPGFYRSGWAHYLQPMQEVAESKMTEFLAEVQKACPGNPALQSADTRLVTGLPSGRIVEVASLLKASLIVIGSRGLTGLPHLLLGSVAERVVQLARLPVVVVKAEKKAKKRKQATEPLNQPEPGKD